MRLKICPLFLDIRELKIMSISYFLLLSFLIVGGEKAISLKYTVVEEFGNSCPQLDSCEYKSTPNRRDLSSLKERNCACDYLCNEYNDCCIDAQGLNFTGVPTEYSCHDMIQYGGVYIKDKCLKTYNGPKDIKHLCEIADSQFSTLSDPLGSMPATDSVTGVTYKNYYCSICNDNTENIVLWTPRLECPTVTLFNSSKDIDPKYVFSNLKEIGGSWGLYLSNDNGSLFFHDCEIEPVMPKSLVSKIRPCKPDLISDCPAHWEDAEVQRLCTSYMGARFVHGGNKYRNVHCALCNGVNTTHLSCQFAEMRGMVFFRQFESHSFSLLLDINEARGQEVGFIQICEDGEVYDPFFKKCRSLSCLPGFIKKDNQCIQNKNSTDSFSDKDLVGGSGNYVDPSHTFVPYKPISKNSSDLELTSGATYNLSNETTELVQHEISKFQNCLLLSLSAEDYLLLENSSIYVPKYDKMYEPTAYHTKDGSTLICSHLNTEKIQKFVPVMGYVTMVGLGTSMACLLLHFIAFCCVPDLRNLSGKNLTSQCVSLFAAYTFFITGLFDLSPEACSCIAFLTYFFFQKSFCWMAIMAFDVWRTLRVATTELRVSSGRKVLRFLTYFIIAFTVPLGFVSVMGFAEYTEVFPENYRPGFADPRCWFKHRRALLVFFALPLFAIVIVNAALFTSSYKMINSTTQVQSKHSKSQKRNYKLFTRLAVLMGLTWIFGLIAGTLDVAVLWYIFILMNTFQGLFIFIAFTCSTKVLNYVQEKMQKSPRPREFGNSIGSNTSTTIVQSSGFAKKLSLKYLISRGKSSNSINSVPTASSNFNAPI